MQQKSKIQQLLQKTPESLQSQKIQQSLINILFISCFKQKRKQFSHYLSVLMKKGANINSIQQGLTQKTVLMTACGSGQVEIVKKMIEYNPDLGLKDHQNKNALFYAIDYNKNQSIQILDIILTKHSDLINIEASNRKTLLLHAIQFMNEKIIKFLLDRGANVNAFLSDTLQNSLHLAVKKCRKLDKNSSGLNIISMLIQKRCNKQAKNKQLKTPLQLCQDQNLKAKIQQIFNYTPKFENQQNNQRKQSPQILVLRRSMIIENNQKIKNRLNNHNSGEEIKLDNIKDQKNIGINNQIKENNEMIQNQQNVKINIINNIKNGQKKQQQKQETDQKLENQDCQDDQEIRNWLVPPQKLKHYLEQQINIFTHQIQSENNQNKKIFDQLISLISKVLDTKLNLEVMVYGSYATRLCLKQSDIDVVVKPKIGYCNNPGQLLQKIDQILKQLAYVKQTNFISTAFMPVIKVKVKQQYKNKRIDITLQTNNHNGLRCVQIIKKYMNHYPELQPLAFVLKTFIYHSNLYDTYQGGLSSYGLIIMIVAFLKKQYYLKQSKQKFLISELLIKFLFFFGFQFDYINKAIYVQNPQNQNQPYHGFVFALVDPLYAVVDTNPKLYLLDPLNINNNVGRPTHQVKNIQMAFSIAYISICKFYNCGQNCKYQSRIQKNDKKSYNNSRPCCILKRMFSCCKNIMKLVQDQC